MQQSNTTQSESELKKQQLLQFISSIQDNRNKRRLQSLYYIIQRVDDTNIYNTKLFVNCQNLDINIRNIINNKIDVIYAE